MFFWWFCCQVIQACMDLLTADRANVMVLSKRYDKPGFCTHREKWFKTPYKVEGQFTLHWYMWFCFITESNQIKSNQIKSNLVFVKRCLNQRFPTFFISFPIWCRPKVAVSPSYNHLIFASFSQSIIRRWHNNNTNVTVNNNNGCIYYSAWLELIKNHLAMKVFSNAVRNVDNIRNISIS